MMSLVVAALLVPVEGPENLDLPRSLGSWEVQAVDKEGRVVPLQGGTQEFGTRLVSDTVEIDLGVNLRYSFPDGAAGDAYYDDGYYYYYAEDHLRYEDLWDPGWTFGSEIAVMVRLGGGMQGSAVGGYFAYAFSRFDGDGATDALGSRIEPDEMELHSWTLGGRWRSRMSELVSLQFHMGMGWTRYEAVSASFQPWGGSAFNVELIEACERFTFDTGFQVGFHLDRISFSAGFVSRSIDGAESDFNGLTFDPHTLWIFDLVVGFTIGL